MSLITRRLTAKLLFLAKILITVTSSTFRDSKGSTSKACLASFQLPMLKIHLARPECYQPSQALPVRHLVYKARKLQLLWLRKNPDRMLRYVRKELLYGIQRQLYLNSQLLLRRRRMKTMRRVVDAGMKSSRAMKYCRSLLN